MSYRCNECDTTHATMYEASQCHWGIGGVVEFDPRNNPEDAYLAFMGMGESEWQGLLRSLLSGGVLQPAEQIGFERALLGPDSRDARDRT